MERKQAPVVLQFVGYSDSGKTTMLERLIPLLREAGKRIGVIKHDGHDFEIDQEGKDTWRYRQAGAEIVAIQSATKTAWIQQRAVPLEQLVERMAEAGAELILVEGFKREGFPKLVFLRRPEDCVLLEQVSQIIAVVCWESALDEVKEQAYPRFSIDDAAGVARFILQR